MLRSMFVLVCLALGLAACASGGPDRSNTIRYSVNPIADAAVAAAGADENIGDHMLDQTIVSSMKGEKGQRFQCGSPEAGNFCQVTAGSPRGPDCRRFIFSVFKDRKVSKRGRGIVCQAPGKPPEIRFD